MSTPKPQVTIVGLGLIGASIGLALRQSEAASAVVGHDKDGDANNEAKKLGAVDRTDWNLVSACEKSDLIVLATPLGAIEPTLQAIGPYLKSGCVVLDTASVKEPVLTWAAEILPDTVYFVGGNPIVGPSAGGQSGLAGARADLFENSLFCLIPAPGVDEHAVRMATNLVSILGARPLFFDAAEHDGLLAAVDQLPAILSMALARMAIDQPTWRELRKVAGTSFEAGTRLTSTDPDVYADLAVSNRDNLVRWIDTFSESLASIRQTLLEGEPEDLTKQFEVVLEERNKWLRDQAVGQWDEGIRQELPERPGLIDTFFGGFWRKGSKREQ
jgi:prephenate dehydrogenase